MNDNQERKLIKEATHEALVDLLLAMGVDVSDPESVKQMQKDMHWVRSGRKASEQMPVYVKRAGLSVLATVTAYIIWSGLGQYWPFK